jgi:DNA topoisomerase-2
MSEQLLETPVEEFYFDYQQRTEKEHILERPDTYVGSVELTDMTSYIYENNHIMLKQFQYIPALFKLFDEAIVNCRDHVVRMQTKIKENVPNSIPVKHIEVSITEDGTIEMMNDGNGLDVAQHPTLKTWLPELMFCHLRSSGNFKEGEERTTGGKNGFGSKLIYIWSTYGLIETVDHIRGLKYRQEFRDNLSVIGEPVITKCKGKPYTKIAFKPDYARLHIENISPDVLGLFIRRVYDISAVTDKTVSVKYNGIQVSAKNFKQYVELYFDNEMTQVYESPNERWEYIVVASPFGEFRQVSFVNGIHTMKGGRHIDYICDQITEKLIEYVQKKRKVSVNKNVLKAQMMIFLRCDIINPSFDGQVKEYLTTVPSKFGSRCEVSDTFITKVAKLGIVEQACEITEVRETRSSAKKTQGRSATIRGIPKLCDANFAGTAKSQECKIILTEGDSAKAGALSGLKPDDRNYIGIFPLKGKLPNTRDKKITKTSKDEGRAINVELYDIAKILGLEIGKTYTKEDIHKYLRYGQIWLMTDQDLDGSHIKGLVINFLLTTWPVLEDIDGFIGFMNTPIKKATHGNNTVCFYNEKQYKDWVLLTANASKWKIQYYKGLGTSTKAEFVEYLKERKIVEFCNRGETSENALSKAFSGQRADDRKQWLATYDKERVLDTNQRQVNYEDFIDYELIHFSKYDCERSIGNLMDGLKISLRKILYSAFLRNLTTPVKVAQFVGYVSEKSCYHHGEASLMEAIIGMAQDFMGSNNVNLLEPLGQFGTRIMGGKDSASPRYIFTKLSEITRLIFRQQDDAILDYLDDDGQSIEPAFYVPIVPMVLVNGCIGIGTGFSTNIMCYNLVQIIDYLLARLNNEDTNGYEFMPYYNKFGGTISKVNETKYMFRGNYELNENVLKITELPVGVWTENVKKIIDGLKNDRDADGNKIIPLITEKEDDKCTDTTIDFTIKLSPEKRMEIQAEPNGLEKTFHLTSTKTTTNMHLFNENGQLVKYETVKEIIDAYYPVRLRYYEKRRVYMIQQYENELAKISNKVRFITEIMENVIDIRRKPDAEVNMLLTTRNYLKIDDKYDYLLDMKIHSFTKEKVDRLLKEQGDTEQRLENMRNVSNVEIWKSELIELREAYIRQKEEEAIQRAKEQEEANNEDVKKETKTRKPRQPRKPATSISTK